MKNSIQTDNAPAAIGAYSQAIRCGDFVFVSGQIPLDPASGEVIAGDAEAQIRRAFANLAAVCQAAGGALDDIVKLTVYLTDLSHFPVVNSVMGELFCEPFPARAALGVASLPKQVLVEVEAVLFLRR